MADVPLLYLPPRLDEPYTSTLSAAELVLARLGPCGDVLRDAGLEGAWWQLHRLRGCLIETIADLQSPTPALSWGQGTPTSPPQLLLLPNDDGDSTA